MTTDAKSRLHVPAAARGCAQRQWHASGCNASPHPASHRARHPAPPQAPHRSPHGKRRHPSQHTHHRQRPAQGFALLDALLASFVLALSLSVHLRWQSQMQHQALSAQQQSEALQWARTHTERWRSALQQALPSATGDADSSEPAHHEHASLSTTYSVTSQRWSEPEHPALHGLRVQVQWEDPRGQPQRLTMQAWATRPHPAHAAALLMEKSDRSLQGQ